MIVPDKVTKFRVVENLIDQQVISPWCDAGLDETVESMAPDGAVAAVVNAKLVRPSDPEWRRVPPLGARVTFAVTESKPEYLIPVYGPYVWYKDLFTYVKNMFDMFFNRPEAPTGPGGDNTYGFGDIQPTGANGATIPVAYGDHPVAGLIAQQYTEEGEENNQKYEATIILSHGPVDTIGDAGSGTGQAYTSAQTDLSGSNIPGGTWINGTLVEANHYKNFTTSLRVGATTQTPMARRVVRQFPMSFTLKQGADAFTYQTRGVCDAIEVDILFPRGLYKTSATGKPKSLECEFQITVTDETAGLEYDETITVKKKLMRPIYVTRIADRRTEAPNAGDMLAPGRKTVTVEKLSKDRPSSKKTNSMNEMTVISVKEIQLVPVAFNGLAVVNPKIQASEQLSGGIPSFTWFGKWRKVQTSDGSSWSGTETWSSNPAYICADILTNPNYGLGNWHSYDDLDPAEWKAWADFCDELVDLYTGSGDQEKRAEFHGVFMEADRAFDMALVVARVGLAGLIRNGRRVTPVLAEDRTYSAVVNSASIRNPAITFAGERGRANTVEVRFRNRYKPNYEMDVATARVPGLDEFSDSVRKMTIDHIGCTSPWQAYRFAHRVLRSETQVRRALSFEASKETLQFAIGDVFLYVDDELRFGVAGSKLAGGDDSPAETYLEREIDFEADVIYTYVEQNLVDDTLLSRDFSFATATTTDTLPFEPLHGAGVGDPTPIGRNYTITRKGTERLYRVIGLGSPNDGWRRVDAVEHVPAVFTDDAPELDTGTETPTFSAVNSASNVAVTETSTRENISTLSVSFTPGAGSNKRHKLYYRIGETGLSAGPEKAASPIAFDLEVEMGTPITVWIQTINEDGATDAFASWPSAEYTIKREDEGSTIVDIPSTVLNLAFTGVSGNTATLDWDEPASGTPDGGYEVRVGNWNGGETIYTGSTSSVAVVRPVHGTFYEVRAKNDGYYSPEGGIESTAVAHATYTTATLTEDIDLQVDGLSSNMVPVPDWHRFNGPMLQAVPEAPVSYVSEVFDTGASPGSVPTLVCVDPSVSSYFTLQADEDYYTSMQHVGSYGELNKAYISWNLYVEHSTDGATWTVVNWADYANADLVVTARYFRLRFEGEALATEDDTTLRLGLVLLERLHLALRR